MVKSKKLPAMPFYFGDWQKDPGIRALTHEERGVWLEIMGLMWESEERGKLLLNGEKVESEVLARQLGIDKILLEQISSKLLKFGIASVDPLLGCLINRRMVRDEEIRKIRQKVGRKGGKASVNKRLSENNFAQPNFKQNTKQNTENEYENVIENENESFVLEKKDDVQQIFEHWQKIHNHPRAKLDKKLKEKIEARLKAGYTKERIFQAIENIRNSAHHMGKNDTGTVYDSLELICRSGSNIDRFADLAVAVGSPEGFGRYERAMI